MIRILNSEEIDVETFFSRILVELCMSQIVMLDYGCFNITTKNIN